jgi:hypothetical protein
MLNDQSLGVSQEDLFRKALELTQTLGIVEFDECVEALKRTKGNVEAAKMLLVGTSLLQRTV